MGEKKKLLNLNDELLIQMGGRRVGVEEFESWFREGLIVGGSVEGGLGKDDMQELLKMVKDEGFELWSYGDFDPSKRPESEYVFGVKVCRCCMKVGWHTDQDEYYEMMEIEGHPTYCGGCALTA